ncbi:UDP-2,4-diacetamido-2,4,6-trideoxy-beta-L-altropyranose hydrolase [Pelagibius litoralis]|uniref:UDP-2,4-diacetamido-2,4, 6-trideoxy-beta-L-altropyranose hydrolase n=1 Tax=Pelagibius litoralis TaxID=374515 RepID=A0A967C7G9_9PROT|nr:UDP-2,4-diacetamido-2,4,6-trideoxy-beta-L-altropyranose hydrolase [Pelagibius litoralis]NIA69026.1 UDP-2,4-diacetamido-2,4,6-trideoxy-beta-L-altropyranose hydrolase [Pelagibius litoralis]
MRTVFRADASAALGGGHVMRCLTLAKSLEKLGWQCGFAVNATALEIIPALAGEDILVLDSIMAAEAENIRKNWPDGADWLIVDHYERDAGWEAGCRGWAKNILVIDDLADRPHDCDVLLDQTPGRASDDYAGLVPPGTRLLTGCDYALLRPAFAGNRQTSLARRTGAGRLNRILVSIGATDPDNHSLVALQAIAESGLPLAVDVVLGAAAPHRSAVSAQIETMGKEVRLHVDVANMPELMARADLAIGAAGTSTWERCCLGLPSLMLVVAENQRLIAERIATTGAARVISGPRDALADRIAGALRDLADDGDALSDMAAKAARICDGRGCDRLGLELVPPGQAKNGRPVALRLATANDEGLILEWQRHPTSRRFARNPQVPSAKEHHQWFTARLADPECLLTMITLNRKPAGVLRLDPVAAPAAAPQTPAFEVSILISPEHRGQRVAEEALRFARRWQQKAVIVAEVLPENEASVALFQRAQYGPGAGGLLYNYP